MNSKMNDELRSEYNFCNAVRGKHYKPLHEGYTVHIHQADGTTLVQNFKLEKETVMLDPDLCEVFLDSAAVNNDTLFEIINCSVNQKGCKR